MANATLEREMRTFERKRSELEADHNGQWVVIHDDTLAGTYDTFESAAEHAVQEFGRGPYLIRQVGAPPVVLPASVVYNLARAED